MNYKTLLTQIGAAKIANFINTGLPVNIKMMSIGDGGGVPVEPNVNTGLVREVARIQINSMSIDPLNPAQVIVEAVLPESLGGFYVREAGLYDDEENLIAVGNIPESYKPVVASGSGKSLTIKLVLLVSNVSAVTLRIDPSIVLASQAFVANAISKALVSYALKDHKHKAADITDFDDSVRKKMLTEYGDQKFSEAVVARFSGDENHVWLPSGHLLQFWTVTKGINDQTVQYPIALTARPITAPVISLVSGFSNNDSYCVVSWSATSCVLRGRVPAGNGAGGVMSLMLISKP